MRTASVLVALIPSLTACCWLGGNAGQVAQIPPPNPPGPAARPVVVINGVECPVVEPLPCRVKVNGLDADQLERIAASCRQAGEVVDAVVALSRMGEEGYVRQIRLLDSRCWDAVNACLSGFSDPQLSQKYADVLKPRLRAHLRSSVTGIEAAFIGRAASSCAACQYVDLRPELVEALERFPEGSYGRIDVAHALKMMDQK